MKKIIVTRHPALLDFLREFDLVQDGVEVLTHATIEDVRGKHVFGVLPMRLAAEAGLLTEVSLTVPAAWRGQELTLEQIKSCSPTLTTYEVTKKEEL